jgi:hypothetical protein
MANLHWTALATLSGEARYIERVLPSSATTKTDATYAIQTTYSVDALQELSTEQLPQPEIYFFLSLDLTADRQAKLRLPRCNDFLRFSSYPYRTFILFFWLLAAIFYPVNMD